MTMHNQQIVACVKCDGKILRERGDVVTMAPGQFPGLFAGVGALVPMRGYKGELPLSAIPLYSPKPPWTVGVT